MPRQMEGNPGEGSVGHGRGLYRCSCGSTWCNCRCLGQVTLGTVELCCVTLTCVLLLSGHSLSQLLDRAIDSQEAKPLKADWFQRKGTSQIPASSLLKMCSLAHPFGLLLIIHEAPKLCFTKEEVLAMVRRGRTHKVTEGE